MSPGATVRTRVWRQMLEITLANLRTLPSRLGASCVVVVGVAGVVFVTTALFAMANGLADALRSSGEADRALILGKGSHSEINGSITRTQAAIITALPGIVAERTDANQRVALASAEIYATVNLPARDGSRAGLPLRGVGADALRVRPEVRVTQGRAIAPGSFELMIGDGAARIFDGLDVGDTVSIKGAAFTVVGRFSSGGRASDSEAWIDVDAMASVFKRGPYLQSILVRLESPAALATLAESLDADRRLSCSVFRESDFYATQSDTSTRLMKLVGGIAGAIMALGATFAALNALYASVSARTREIAILRAIGFTSAPIVVSVVAEAVLLALLGGALGAGLGALAFDGRTAASMGATYSQVAFRFDVTPALVAANFAVALAIGLAGGLAPALHAARRNIVSGLRAIG